MVTVSENILYLKLENIDMNNQNFWTKFVNDIRYSLSKIPDPDNKIMVIKIQNVAYDSDSMIPKLEYKNLY